MFAHLSSESPKSGRDAPPTLSCVGVNPAALPAPSSDMARLSTEKILDPAILVQPAERGDVFVAATLAAALPAAYVEKNADGWTADAAKVAARAADTQRESSIILCEIDTRARLPVRVGRKTMARILR